MRAKKPKFKKLTRNLKKKKAKQRNFQGNVIKVRLPAHLHRNVKLTSQLPLLAQFWFLVLCMRLILDNDCCGKSG